MRICIDAGHIKGYNVGVDKAYNEGEMAWRLSHLLGEELQRYGIEVAYSRDDISKDLALELRGKVAHDNGSDLFISLHSDGFTNPTAKGVTVFYSNHRKGTQTLGKALGDTVAALMNTPARGAMTRLYGGAYPQADYYGVIRGAVGFNGERSPKAAFLIEHGFHTNPDDCRWLMQDDNLKRLAAAEARVIAEHYGLQTIQTPPTNGEDWKGKYFALQNELRDIIKKYGNKGA